MGATVVALLVVVTNVGACLFCFLQKTLDDYQMLCCDIALLANVIPEVIQFRRSDIFGLTTQIEVAAGLPGRPGRTR